MIILKGIYILAFCFLVIVGSMTLFCPFIKLIVQKRKYQKVKAVCVGMNTSQKTDNEGFETTMYQPVWEYYYDSQKYTSSMASRASFMNIPVGTEKIIYVNPENPLDISAAFIRSFVFTTIFGLAFLGAAVLMLKYNL